MLIDKIMDRIGGETYSARQFYSDARDYGFERITLAMDYGTEDDVQDALCDYIFANDYNPEICKYICTHTWLADDKESHQ